MELNLFNKINLTLHLVNESFTSFQRNYGEFSSRYIGYDKTLVDNQPAAPDILRQFQEVTVRDLFKASHLEQNYYGDNYLDLPATRFREERVGVHYELSPYLFYYLANSLKAEIKGFLNLVRSDEFRRDFSIDVSINEGVLKYSFDKHNQISNYIRARIPLYNRMFNLLNQTTKVFLAINSDTPYFEIELRVVDNILEVVDNRYDFDVIELK